MTIDITDRPKAAPLHERALAVLYAGVILLLIAIGLAGFVTNATAASSTGIDFHPPFTPSTNIDNGLHFDETDYPAFGAYDYPSGGNYGVSQYFRATVRSNLFFDTRYKYGEEDDCLVVGQGQIYVGGAWSDVSGWNVHYIHLDNMPAQWTYTGTLRNTNDSFYVYVGQTDNCGLSTGPHAHFSIDMSGAIEETPKSSDTCWAGGSQCSAYTKNIGTVRKDNPSATCPPSSQSGTASYTSGSATRYVCATWQSVSRSTGSDVFNIP